MGKALAYGLEIIGTGTPLQKEESDASFKIKSLSNEAEKQKDSLSTREMCHVKALQSWTQG